LLELSLHKPFYETTLETFFGSIAAEISYNFIHSYSLKTMKPRSKHQLKDGYIKLLLTAAENRNYARNFFTTQYYWTTYIAAEL
jgi:hypothetical protein